MNQYLKNYLVNKYNKMDVADLEQQSEFVKYSLEKQNSKMTYLDKKGDAVTTKLEGLCDPYDKGLDKSQAKKLLAKNVAKYVVPGAIIGGVIGSAVVGAPEVLANGEVDNALNVTFGLYGAGVGTMLSSAIVAAKPENLKNVCSLAKNLIQKDLNKSKLERLEEKGELIESILDERLGGDNNASQTRADFDIDIDLGM